jgi:hypothetical protein
MMHVLKALPELISAGLLFALWAEPARFGADWFKSGVLTMLLEFFVVHATGFMSVLMYDPETSKSKRSLQIGGLSVFYFLMVSAFAWGFNAWWMVGAFAWLCFSKLQAIWGGGTPTEHDRFVAMASWALSVAVYLGAVGLSVAYDIPRLGATDAIRDAAGFTGGGEWEREPWRALAGGVAYFAVMGLSRPLFSLWQASGRRTAGEPIPPARS